MRPAGSPKSSGTRRTSHTAVAIAQLPIQDEDRKHFLACMYSRTACGQCTWAVNKAAWRKRLCHSHGDDWVLESTDEAGTRVIGCRLCKASGADSKMGKVAVPVHALQWKHMEQHCNTAVHRKAVLEAQGEDAAALRLESVPSTADFQAVLDATRAGQCTSNLTKVGRSKKLRKMKWCLAEARRAMTRKHIKPARVMALHQDVRKQWLAIRFSACGPDLVARVGVLGVANLPRNYSLDALGIRQATIDIVKQFCTSCRAPPFAEPPTAAAAEPDHELEDHVRGIVELLDADAASDEAKAAKLLRGEHPLTVSKGTGGIVCDFDKYFRNIKIQNKDKAHASRRTASLHPALCFTAEQLCKLRHLLLLCQGSAR